jgi:hypothetical protein
MSFAFQVSTYEPVAWHAMLYPHRPVVLSLQSRSGVGNYRRPVTALAIPLLPSLPQQLTMSFALQVSP